MPAISSDNPMTSYSAGLKLKISSKAWKNPCKRSFIGGSGLYSQEEDRR
jgi:hypothetical protein